MMRWVVSLTGTGDRSVHSEHAALARTHTGFVRAVGSGIGDGLIHSGSFASRCLRVPSDDHLINRALPASV